MPMIGVRELRERTAEVLRQVREQQAEYIITHQGRPVALLLPVDAQAIEKAIAQAGGRSGAAGGWEAYARLAEQLRQRWPASQTTSDLLDAIRQ